MIQRHHAPIRAIFVIAAVLAVPTASSAQVKVLMSGGFAAAYQEVLPEFERTTGITVTTTRGQSQGDVPAAIGPQLRRGVPADVVILSREGLDALIAEGRIVTGTDVDLAQTPLVTTLFPRLGIASEMARKSTSAGLAAMAKGEVEIALQPVSEKSGMERAKRRAAPGPRS